MSQDKLSDDLSEWPGDPHQLFGLPHGFEPEHLKRAYARLLRRFKPEHFPEHFRRIRNAYEYLTLMANHATSSLQPVPLPVAPAPSQATSLDERDAAWQLAIKGKEQHAYRELLQLHNRQPDDAEILIKLYWLLVIWPEVDSASCRMDWLLSAVRTGSGTARQLLRRELRATPRMAVTEGFNLLIQQDLPARVVAELIEWRWQCAWRLRLTDVVPTDLRSIRYHFGSEHIQDWAHLLMVALLHLMWLDERPARNSLQECRKELEGLTELHLGMLADFDRLDNAFEVCKRWRMWRWYKCAPAQLLDVIAQSIVLPWDWTQRSLLDLASEMVREPKWWLKRLRWLNKIVAGAPLAHLCDQLSFLHLQNSWLDDPPSDVQQRAAIEFLEFNKTRVTLVGAKGIRSRLLEFCVRECIDPTVVANMALHHPSGSYPNALPFSRDLTKDLALRCVWLAHRCIRG